MTHVFNSGWCSKGVSWIYRLYLKVPFCKDKEECNYSIAKMLKRTNVLIDLPNSLFGGDAWHLGLFWGLSRGWFPICLNHSGAREEPGIQQAQRRSAVFLSFKSPIPCLPLRWEQQSKLLPTVAGIPASKVSKWSTDEVYLTFSVCQGVERAVLV